MKIVDSKLSAVVNLDDSVEIMRVSTERDTIVGEKDRLSRIYNEAFFTLKAVLSNIKLADNFLQKLDEVHNGAGYRHPQEESYGQWIGAETEEMIQEFTVFMNKYVEK